MKRGVLLFAGVTILAAGVWSAVADNGPDVQPAIKPGTAAQISAFWTNHPDWRVLSEPRIDATPIRFEHAVHLNPATPQMQTRLKAWIEDLHKRGVPEGKIPVTRGPTRETEVRETGTEPLSLSCIACHEPDAAGRYMKPIVFESHCIQCHGLGSRGGEAVPHGSGIAAFLDRAAKQAVLTPAKETAKPASGGTSSGGPRKGGPRGGAASSTPAAEAPKPVTFESEKAMIEALTQRMGVERDKLARSVKANCNKCHGLETPVDKVSDPRIPDRWLPRAGFDHKAHGFMGCVSCHSQASPPPAGTEAAPALKYVNQDDPASPAYLLRWTGRTRDVMIPSIHNCLACHRPTDAAPPAGVLTIPGVPQAGPGAKSGCVDCHVYHTK
ncbi:MAG: DUF3365 domain-containing protein [Planctomycetes bacterium]|nr:DUF3365 domain-containing protein [Planctomycetota bacterium]